MTMLVLMAAAVFIFLTAAAVLFHDPLTHVFKTRELAEERKLLADQQEAEARALKEAIAERLDQAEDALAELRSANAQFALQVEAIVGLPAEAAIKHPPTYLRHAVLSSEKCLNAWAAVINAYVTPQQFDAYHRRLDFVQAELQQGAVAQSHRRDLDDALQSLRGRRDAIALIDLGPLSGDNDIDMRHAAHTITLQERR